MSTFSIENPCCLIEELPQVRMAGGVRRLATMIATRRFSAGARNQIGSGSRQTYLERDLRQLSAIYSLPNFQRLVE